MLRPFQTTTLFLIETNRKTCHVMHACQKYIDYILNFYRDILYIGSQFPIKVCRIISLVKYIQSAGICLTILRCISKSAHPLQNQLKRYRFCTCTRNYLLKQEVDFHQSSKCSF
jgi:hypothetical protein